LAQVLPIGSEEVELISYVL